MIPHTYPSTFDSTGRSQMTVYILGNVVGLAKWVDYIPVKLITATATKRDSYDNNGFIAAQSIPSSLGKVSFNDYVPIYIDGAATVPWGTGTDGYIPLVLDASMSELFSMGEQGVWYDPSDWSTLFQDSAGTTPVTAVGQPVGLMLDKRLGLVRGVELMPATVLANFTVHYSANGTVTQEPIGIRITSTSGLISISRAGFSTNVSYEYSFDILSGAGRVENGPGGTSSPVSVGSYRWVCSGRAAFYCYPNNSSSMVIANISVKEVPGNHATQTQTINRPVLQARVNLLTDTEGVYTSYPINSGVSNAVQTIPGFSNSLAFAAGSSIYAYKTSTYPANTVLTLSVYVKMDDGGVPSFSDNLPGYDGAFVMFGGVSPVVSVTNVGNGVYRLSSSANSGALVNTDFGVVKYVGNSSRGFIVTGYQLEASPVATRYQRVNAATDYDSAGFKTYLAFNGSNQWMSTPNIDFTATDKMTVVAGVRKLSDATVGAICELSTNGYDNVGGFDLLAPGITATPCFAVEFKPSGAATGVYPRGFASPVSNVLGISLDAAGSGTASLAQIRLRANGAPIAQASGAGAGNFGNYPLYIGTRGGTTLYFNGNLYGLLIRGALSTTPQIAGAETYMNSKTGAF